MDKPIKGVALGLFLVWLAVPLVWFAVTVFPFLFTGGKSTLLTIAFVIFFPLVCFLVFGTQEFRAYDRVTPRRLLTFFTGIFLFVVVFMGVFGLVDQSLRWSSAMIRFPSFWALAVTPAFTLRATFMLPKVSSPAKD